MRELLVVILIGAAGYLAYDDYYKQRPALQQAQAEIQQLRQNPVRLNVATPGAPRTWTPVAPTAPPAWFQQRLEDSSTLDSSRKHKQKDSQQP